MSDRTRIYIWGSVFFLMLAAMLSDEIKITKVEDYNRYERACAHHIVNHSPDTPEEVALRVCRGMIIPASLWPGP